MHSDKWATGQKMTQVHKCHFHHGSRLKNFFFLSLCIQMSWQFPSLLWQWHSSLSLPRCSICPPRHFWGQERRATASLWNIMDKRAAATTTAIPQNISLLSGFDMIGASVFIGPYFDHFLVLSETDLSYWDFNDVTLVVEDISSKFKANAVIDAVYKWCYWWCRF